MAKNYNAVCTSKSYIYFPKCNVSKDKNISRLIFTDSKRRNSSATQKL